MLSETVSQQYEVFNDVRLQIEDERFPIAPDIAIIGKNTDLNIYLDIEIDEPYWIAVEPITWLIDEKENIALSKKILFHIFYYPHFVSVKTDS